MSLHVKKLAATVVSIGILSTGGLSAHANELKITPIDQSFVGCKDISKNQETNEYVKNCFKMFPNFPLGPKAIKVPDTPPYDDGTYQGILYLISQKSSMYSIVAYYEGSIKKYK
ncbi:hypothetical protein COL63_22330 [Bacillus pseudomycoides]|nr:hypothetical protein COL63_22330 [Bacillus pseudomycoides]